MAVLQSLHRVFGLGLRRLPDLRVKLVLRKAGAKTQWQDTQNVRMQNLQMTDLHPKAFEIQEPHMPTITTYGYTHNHYYPFYSSYFPTSLSESTTSLRLPVPCRLGFEVSVYRVQLGCTVQG